MAEDDTSRTRHTTGAVSHAIVTGMRQLVRFASVLGAAAMCVITMPARTQARLQGPQGDLDGLVARVASAAKQYEMAFHDLVADETRLLENFDQSGRVTKRREISGDLLVYTSRDSTDTAEYRDVRAIDGKAIEKRSKRALDLLTRALRSASTKKELDLINKEGQRSDIGYSFHGLTIGQPGSWFAKPEEFRIESAGRAQVGGHEVILLDYQAIDQKKLRSDAAFYKRNGFSASVLRGRLWIDAATSQLRQQRLELAFVHPLLAEPVVILHQEATYTESRFGILVPERVVYDIHERGKQAKNQPPSFFRAARTTCTYGTFRKFEVETEHTIDIPSLPQR